VYFDNHATTAVDPRVLAVMLPTFSETYGNPESGHPFGWSARLLVEQARAQVAILVGATDPSKEIVFTAGATESIHLAISSQTASLTAHQTLGTVRPHIITANTEHHATLEACAAAERAGADLTILQADKDGLITPEQVIAAVKPNTTLVTLMHANNEIGTIHPIAKIGKALRAHGKAHQQEILFHVDAAQTAGKHEINVDDMSIDLLSLSAHKFHGPKGVGALYVRHTGKRFVRITPLFTGGGQERGLRSGTLNVSGIVGLGHASELAADEHYADRARLTGLRNLIITEVESKLKDVKLNGHRTERLCNNINFTFKGVEQDQLMFALKDFAYSAASACVGPTQSHVLAAIGAASQSPTDATIRIGLSRLTKAEEVSS
ncbi:MAG: cysteine desulfurase, partial [Alphaproteobacteria bacterium]